MRHLLAVPVLMCLIGATSPPDPVEQLRLGYRLAVWARGAGDADAMLAAARIIAATGARGAKIGDGMLRPDDRPSDQAAPAALLAREAVRMAPQDKRIAALAAAVIDSVPKGFSAGPSGNGPLTVQHRLPARMRVSWSATARGGETAIVSVVGDGDSNIDLRVTDRAGRGVCADRQRDYYPVCRWKVRSAGAYRIEVSNAGTVPSNVVILSN